MAIGIRSSPGRQGPLRVCIAVGLSESQAKGSCSNCSTGSNELQRREEVSQRIGVWMASGGAFRTRDNSNIRPGHGGDQVGRN